MTTAIEARNLVKTYPGGVRALDGLSFAVEAGTIFALLGPNGAGKSTTVKILTTLSRPDEGEAWVAGHDALREPELVRRAIGVVSQRSGVDREATGRENLALQGQIYGLGGRELQARVSELLKPLWPDRGRRPARANLLRRHAAAARHRDGARAPPAGAVSG
jgi:ABC-2 type transport system ATP-binding protein